MTVIAALKKDDELWMVSDRRISWGTKYKRDDILGSKVFRLPHAFIGSSGPSVYHNVLRYVLKNHPDLTRNPFDSDVAVLEFFFELHNIVKNKFGFGSPQHDEFPKMSSSYFIVVTRNQIFDVASSRDVIEYPQYTAVGSGKQYILGAMEALYPLMSSPREILQRAYEVALQFDPICGGEMELIHVSQALSEPFQMP